MEYYFHAKQLSVGYHKIPLIKDIEFCLEKGEILTLIGPNGAGKSTVLKSITRQLSLLEGVICLNRKNMLQMSGSELSRNMAVVLTDKIKSEMMTCEDVVATGRYPYTGRLGILSENDNKIVEETMELVHVTAFKDQDFTQISDGQRQRVMLARAICQEPEIIILDEPTSYLDIKYKLEFLTILQEMRRKKGLTVIMSLHELELAARVSDKILCINGKYVDRFGAPEEIFVPGYITSLFHISVGSFNEENGSMELATPQKEAKVFVIAGGGSGRNIYRKLQREGTAFITGILFQNDLDYPVAKALAVEVIEAEAFEPMNDTHLKIAKERAALCETIICCRKSFGSLEAANQELLAYANQCGKVIQMSDA